MNRNNERKPKRLPEKTEKASSLKREVTGEAELPMFDYSVERVDRVKFNESKKNLIDYIGTKYGFINCIIEKEEEPNFRAPPVPTAAEIAADGAEIVRTRYNADYQSFRKKTDAYEDAKPKVFSLLWSLCTTAMRNQLKSFDNFSIFNENKDALQLWLHIQHVSLAGSAVDQNSVKRKTDAHFRFNRFKQGKSESIGEFYERFQVEYEAFRANGGRFIEKETEAVMFDEDRERIQQELEYETERMLAMHFLEKLDRTRYGRMMDELQNLYDRGAGDQYPVTLNAAYHMAINRRDDGIFADTLTSTRSETGAAFATQGRFRKGNHGKKNDSNSQNHAGKIQGTERNSRKPDENGCYFCNKPGHMRRDCHLFKKAIALHEKDQQKEAQTLLTINNTVPRVNHGFTGCTISECFAADKAGFLENNDILCDNQSNVNIFRNGNLLSNIRKTRDVVYITGIFGQSIRVDTIGEYDWFGTVYYHPKAVGNILCFYDVVSRFKVSFDDGQNFFKVKSGTNTINFVPKNKLYVYKHESQHKTKKVAFVQTVEDIKKRFTAREIASAELAASIYKRVGRPSSNDFIQLITKGSMMNCPITVADFRRAVDIWGIDIGVLKGKSVRSTPEPVPVQSVPSLNDIGPITLCLDLFFIDKTIFLLSISRKLNLLVIRHVPDRKAETLKKATDDIISVYRQFDLAVKFLLCDGEGALFSLKTYYQSKGIAMNPTAKNEHVPEIERSGRMLKERVRAYWCTLPYKLPQIVLIHLAYYCVFWINSFPRSSSYDPDVPPREKVTGKKIDFKRDCRVEFGAFCQVNEDDSVTNTMKERTIDAIALGPAGNAQGSYLFLNIRTWNVVRRRSWTALPMPSTVIDILNNRAQLDDPNLRVENARFAYENGLEVSTPEETEPENDVTTIIHESDEPISIIDDTRPPEGDFSTPANETEVDLPMDNEPPQNESFSESIADDQQDPVEDTTTLIEPEAPVPSQIDTQTPSYNLRPKRSSWKEKYATVLTTYSMNQGVKKFGQDALKSMHKEMLQLHDKKVFHPVHWKDLSPTQRKGVLRSHLFIKKKRDNSIKSRFVGGGNKQLRAFAMVDTNSPTVTTEALFSTIAIDAFEGRHVATMDIEGAYLHADMVGDVYLNIEPILADILCDIDRSYSSFRNSDGRMLVKLDKALYGCIESARLFYDLLSNVLLSLGYEKNPYDQCIFNKTVNGNQCTIALHVDDLKVSCKDIKIIDQLAADLTARFGNVNRHDGPVVDYLGMILDYSNQGVVHLSMTAMIEAITEELGVKVSAVTPANVNLFQVNSDSLTLPQDLKEQYHSVVAKLLYLSKKARPDILTAVSYLTTRVKEPNQDDWNKMIRVVKYLYGTKETHLQLSANKEISIHSYIDSSYAIHPDAKGHTGVSISLGRGSIYNRSSKQKLVSKSSTESELVGLADGLPMVLWTRNFLISQGYDVGIANTYQDNKSTIILAEKGNPASSRTRHINIRYFFVKDRMEKKEVKISYLPTERMIADFYTKPLQGSLFVQLRNYILGYSTIEANQDINNSH